MRQWEFKGKHSGGTILIQHEPRGGGNNDRLTIILSGAQFDFGTREVTLLGSWEIREFLYAMGAVEHGIDRIEQNR